MKNLESYGFYKLLKTLLKDYEKSQLFLRTNKSLKHPNKEIEFINFASKDLNLGIEIMVNFFGLQGSTSQLPSYMLDKLSRNEDNNEGWSLFFDFFNHYLLWFFFESVCLRNYPRSFKEDFSDTLSKILFKMLGINDCAMAKKYLPFAPLLLSLRRPKHYIQRVLQSNFKLEDKLEILENIPHKILISSAQQNRLGNKNHTLGKNFILGKKCTSFQSKIAVYIYGIDYYEALDFLPSGSKFNALKESIMFLTNNAFSVDLYLRVNANKKLLFILGDVSTSKLGFGKILGKHKNPHTLICLKLCA